MQNDNHDPSNPSNQQANYSFIQDYPTPPPKKKLNIKLIILIIGFSIVAIVFLFLVLIGGQDRDPETQNFSTANDNEFTPLFIEQILNNEPTEAFEKLSSSMQEIYNLERFNTEVVEGVKLIHRSSECNAELINSEDTKVSSWVYSCKSIEGDYWAGVGVENLRQDNETIVNICTIQYEEINTCQ